MTPSISLPALNLIASAVTHHKVVSGSKEHMKIALLALLGLALGTLGGAALGIGAGLAWVEIFKTPGFEGDSGMLVFFTFMPLGADRRHRRRAAVRRHRHSRRRNRHRARTGAPS